MKKKKLSFDKDLFKRSVQYNVKTLYRKTMEEATPQELYQASAYAIKDAIVDHWMTTQKAAAEQDPKIVYYMSMEFLMGRAFGNNLINLQAYKPVKEALDAEPLAKANRFARRTEHLASEAAGANDDEVFHC